MKDLAALVTPVGILAVVGLGCILVAFFQPKKFLGIEEINWTPQRLRAAYGLGVLLILIWIVMLAVRSFMPATCKAVTQMYVRQSARDLTVSRGEIAPGTTIHQAGRVDGDWALINYPDGKEWGWVRSGNMNCQ